MFCHFFYVFLQIQIEIGMIMNKEYDLLIVGVGIYGATYAYKAKKEGKRCLVIDQRPHLGGNIYCDLKYKELADQEKGVIFGGRLAEYKYYDIAPIIEKVMNF